MSRLTATQSISHLTVLTQVHASRGLLPPQKKLTNKLRKHMYNLHNRLVYCRNNYKLRFGPDDPEHEWPLECDRCGSPAPTVASDWDDIGKRPEEIPKGRAPKELLCVFCYETHLGSILKYRHLRDNADIARGLCQALNILARKS